MEASSKGALITGGASGMGLAVAKALSARGGWHIHLLDMNAARGEEVVKQQLPNATFHRTNVLDYDSLATTFQSVYDIEGRLDFVFANAGIHAMLNFYETHPSPSPPPPPNMNDIDVNLKGCIYTTHLAQHYFLQSPLDTDKSLVMTASSAGIYGTQSSPIYSASKHGVIGLMRSVAPQLFNLARVRVNAICPSPVRTNVVPAEVWDLLDPALLTPIDKVVSVVLMLIDGEDVGGKRAPSSDIPLTLSKDKLWGKAVEVTGPNHYYRDENAFCDDFMRSTIVFSERQSYE